MIRIGLKVARADFVIHHLGIAEAGPEERSRKMEYYRELGEKSCAMLRVMSVHIANLGWESWRTFAIRAKRFPTLRERLS